MNNVFEKIFNDFLYEIKSNYLSNLLKENNDYIKLTNDMHTFLDDLIDEIPEFDEILDDFLDIFYQIVEIENSFLYLQGYIDCINLLKLLGS